MNITHATVERIEGDKLEAIFNRQKSLMEKYHDIEARSGLCQTEDCPVNLDDKRGQARIKDFAWRVTEEVGEALDAWVANDFEHYCEELIDGLHFLTELTILAGLEPNDVVSLDNLSGDRLDILRDKGLVEDPVLTKLERFVMNLGMTCNCLKNKPWKQTNMITDKEHFRSQLVKTWYSYIGLIGGSLSAEEIALVYLKKSQVNQFRQRSGY